VEDSEGSGLCRIMEGREPTAVDHESRFLSLTIGEVRVDGFGRF